MIPFRILIADDHPLARNAIRSLLQDKKEFQLIGEVENGNQALEACERLLPDVVLMDIHMPIMDGLEATKRIKQRYPDIKIVILTVSDAVADLFTAIQLGAQGYLLKDLDPDDWEDYLLALLQDDRETPRKMANKLFYRFKTNRLSTDAADIQGSTLTPREREILGRVAAGDTNKQIADTLFIAENTVKNHIKNLLEKLEVENRVQLAAYAIRKDWSRSP